MSGGWGVVMLSHNVAESRGTYFRVFNLGVGLARLGHSVTIVATSASERRAITTRSSHGVTIVEAPALLPGAIRSGWDPLDVVVRSWMAGTRKLGRVDIVHAFDSRPNVIVPAIRLARTTGARLVMDWADWWGRGGTIEERTAGRWLRPVVRPLETYFEEGYRTLAEQTTVISRALKERAVSLGVRESTVSLVPNGADTSAIVPLHKTYARNLAGLATSGQMVGYLGSALPRDAELLSMAYSALRRRRPSLRLLVINQVDNGIPDLPGTIRVAAESLDGIATYLACCDLFLLPLVDSIANRGRWPGKINLYMAAGRPTIATPVGEIPGVFGELGGGILADTEDGQFAAAAEALLDDPRRMDEVGRVARELAVARFDWQVIARRLETIYGAAVAGYSGWPS